MPDRAGGGSIRAALPFFSRIVRSSVLPVVGDIHFDPYLALKAMECGVGGIRINPGNIGSLSGVKEILRVAARERNVPIRIGVNSGSIEKKYLRLAGPFPGRANGPVGDGQSPVLRGQRFFPDEDLAEIVVGPGDRGSVSADRPSLRLPSPPGCHRSRNAPQRYGEIVGGHRGPAP